jgi:hypothetical protein
MTKVGDLFTQEIFTPSLKKVQDLTQLQECTGSNLQRLVMSRADSGQYVTYFC